MKWEGVNIRTRALEGCSSSGQWHPLASFAGRGSRTGLIYFMDSEQGQLRERKICVPIFTRAPHQTGMHSLQQTMNPQFFLLAPRLPHVVRGAKDTCESGCEVHDGRVGEECIGVEELSHDSRFFRRRTRTRTTSLSRLLKSTLFSWRKKPTSRPSRPFVK